ncbi:nuclear transport factor 2 family protein [Nocardia otitidiscaviarum]|uniref:nuclear transport factor 2 family protein n=1 Tax=Nocardia otitidiscaviarum TaxID=1823 RepID=UPI001893B971|nr:nuclear transport factor 2 family protein [Nocardia otitidiscaviarum]MBF6179022.1 nuclear transport factor 2 family protein [Nocardia otitidiscaviarum]
MNIDSPSDPAQFIRDFFTSFTDAAMSDGDPAEVVDRFHSREIVQVADGLRIDRDRLIAHLRPIRKTLAEYRFDVHEAMADGGRIAARMTIHARRRNGDEITTDVHFFGEFTPDGRMRRAHQLTRTGTAA